MALQFTLTQGNREIPLIYDATNQQQYKLLYGYSVGASEPQPKWHTPTEGASQLIDLNDQNSAAFFTLDIEGLESPNYGDDVNSAIAKLRKWVDGENQEAARYYITGDNNPVELKVKRGGSAVTTVWGVLYGWVNDASAHYTASARRNNSAFDVVVALTLVPYGEADSWEILKNELLNPDFLLESSTSGQADGWTKLSSPTLTLDTGTKLIGSQSQKIVTSGVTKDGIESPQVAGGSNTEVVGYVWVLVSSGDFDVDLYNVTDTTIVATKNIDSTDSANVSDKTYTDEDGNAWYRISHSETITASKTYSLRVWSSSSGTCFIDGAYLEFNRTDVPPYWSSYYTILNREDVTAGNPEYVNHIHYWGIAGDVPALARYFIDSSVTTSETMYASKVTDGVYTADAIEHWIESTELTATATFPSTFTTGTGTTGNEYNRYTQGSSPSALGSIKYNMAPLSKDVVNAFISVPRRMFIYARSSVSTGTLNLFVNSSSGTLFQVDEIATISSNASFDLYDLGLINLVGLINDNEEATTLSLTINLQVGENLANGDTIDFDCFIFFYSATQDDFIIGKLQNSVSASDWWIDGKKRKVYTKNGTNEPALGGLWALKPELLNKVCFLTTDSTSISITNTYAIETYIKARTKHLLGTL